MTWDIPFGKEATFNLCIFCRENASSSRSIERIIPESLGNIEHVLPAGIVCDRCNNYFARKIEGPLLESAYFRHLRSQMSIANKRGRIPSMRGMLPHLGMGVDVWVDRESIAVQPLDPSRRGEFEQSLLAGQSGRLVLPVSNPDDVDRKLMSRFLLKAAMEALALRTMEVEGWRKELLDMEALDPLRRYVRVGDQPLNWNYLRRSLYPHDALFREDAEIYEVLHEFDFVYTEDKRLFFFIAIFGEEYGIDVSDPDPEALGRYQSKIEGRSPLYK
jgi:hypothetical protein